MAGYNRIIMVGNLTRDPEYKQLASGQGLCKLSIASNRQFKNRQTGNMVQEVCFVDVDVWGAQAESCRQFLQKGRLVLVEGRLKFDTWQDNEGQNRSKHSIVADRVVFLSSAEDSDEEEESSQRSKQPQLERDLLDKIDAIKARNDQASFKAAETKSVNAESSKDVKAPAPEPQKAEGESDVVVEFKDEPPFQDDLPF